MILEWLVGLVAGLWKFIASLLPDWTFPPELAAPGGLLQNIVSLGAFAGNFVDWTFCGIVAAVALAPWVIGLLWKFGRQLFSHIPFFGGNG